MCRLVYILLCFCFFNLSLRSFNLMTCFSTQALLYSISFSGCSLVSEGLLRGLSGQEPLPFSSSSAAVHTGSLFARDLLLLLGCGQRRRALSARCVLWNVTSSFYFHPPASSSPGWWYMDQALTCHHLTSAPQTAASEVLSLSANLSTQTFV